MEANLNSFINNQERAKRVTTNCSDLASSSQQVSPSSPHAKLRSPNTMMLPQETNRNSLQDAKFQPPTSWISGMRDLYIDICRGVSQLWVFD